MAQDMMLGAYNRACDLRFLSPAMAMWNGGYITAMGWHRQSVRIGLNMTPAQVAKQGANACAHSRCVIALFSLMALHCVCAPDRRA
jgi:hypothetical protein